jgi:hypothetical protein
MGKGKGESNKPDARRTVWGKKGKNLNITLTEEGWRLAKERATHLGISVSEVVERWGRGYDTNFNEAVPIPPSLDSRASVVSSMSALELYQALGEKMTAQEIKSKFVDDLLEGNLTEADVVEITGLLDMEDTSVQRAIQIVKSTKKGDKKPNGV